MLLCWAPGRKDSWESEIDEAVEDGKPGTDSEEEASNCEAVVGNCIDCSDISTNGVGADACTGTGSDLG